jgi:putative membrane protein
MYRLLVGLVFALIIALFAIQNEVKVDVRFLGWTVPQVSLVLVILGSSAAGALIMAAIGLFKQVRLGMRLRDCQSQIRRLEANLKDKNDEQSKLKEQVDVLRKALDASTEQQQPEQEA